MSEHEPQLLVRCQTSYRLSDGSVFSRRGAMVRQEWYRECKAVAEHLDIPIEQHWGLSQATEYTVKAVPQPHHGLLGREIIYWLNLNFRVPGYVATGTLMAAIYLHTSDPEAHQQPALLHLEGYDASYVAWKTLAEKEEAESIDQTELWAKTAERLLDSWKRRLSQRLYQVGG